MATKANPTIVEPSIHPHSSPPVAKQRKTVSFLQYASVIGVSLDYLSISMGALVAELIYLELGGIYVKNETLKLFAFSLQYAVAFVLFARTQFLYSYEHSLLQIRETAAILRVSCVSLLLLSVWVLFSRMTVPRLLLLLSWILTTLFLLTQKHLTRRLFAKRSTTHAADRRVLILGCGSDARRVFSFLLNSPTLQMRPMGFFEEQSSFESQVIYSHGYRFNDSAPVHRGQLDKAVLHRLAVDDLIIADPSISQQRLQDIQELSSECGVKISMVGSTQLLCAGHTSRLRVFDGLFVTAFESDCSESPVYEMLKRCTDLVISLVMLLVLFPCGAAISAWVKLSSPGPVFFMQERVGRDGVRFRMYKFRTMYMTTPKYARSPEDSKDPRITAAGRFLRKTSLDELPQILNVLFGDMSLVGPRPEMPYIVSTYDAHQSQRLRVQQGLTGLWQLSADRKHAIHENIEYDLYYVENRSLFLDMAILLHTLLFAAKGI